MEASKFLVTQIHNLGIIFGSSLFLHYHVTQLTKMVIFHIRNIAHLHPFLYFSCKASFTAHPTKSYIQNPARLKNINKGMC